MHAGAESFSRRARCPARTRVFARTWRVFDALKAHSTSYSCGPPRSHPATSSNTRHSASFPPSRCILSSSILSAPLARAGAVSPSSLASAPCLLSLLLSPLFTSILLPGPFLVLTAPFYSLLSHSCLPSCRRPISTFHTALDVKGLLTPGR